MEVLGTILVFILVISELEYVLTLDVGVPSTIRDLRSVNNNVCTEPNCVMKCCPFYKYLTTARRRGQRRQRVCDYFNNSTANIDYNNFIWLARNVFHEYPHLSKLDFAVKAGIFETNETFKTSSMNMSGFFNMHLTEYPEVYLELPNAYERWTVIPNDKFCFDYMVNRKGVVNPGIWIMFPDTEQEYEQVSGINSTVLTAGMLVSCFFLVLVLVVYGALPELRNLGGQILMAYVACQLAAFLLLALMRLEAQEVSVCRFLTFIIYYFLMATFCWMNVMSYDIWWNSRGYGQFMKSRPIYRCSDRCKFLLYCLYAFGLPLAMSAVLIILSTVDMRHVPWFITPKLNGCFIQGGEKLLYLYVPMLILILFNWILFVMTAINVWRLSRAVDAGPRPAHAHRRHRNRFILYLKLSVVMGLNWLLEVVSHLKPTFSAWLISDLCNMLTGVAIFLIFVCDRRILKKLVMRCRPGQNSTESLSSVSDEEELEAQTLQVCANPNK